MGINLTSANHVFLLESFLNPSLEKQAIGRVHRMGQQRPVTIHKMSIKNSIEERITAVVKRRCNNASADNDDEAAVPAARKRKSEVNASIAGSLKADKQVLRSKEYSYLFGAVPKLQA